MTWFPILAHATLANAITSGSSAFAFPKRGLHTRVLWVLVPGTLRFWLVKR